MDALIFVLAGAFATAIPIVLAALGELVAEKTGILNLSVEGMMAIGAAVGFIVTYDTGSHIYGFAAGALAAMVLSLVFAALVLVFSANQVASGLAVGGLGLGLSALIANGYRSKTLTPIEDVNLPLLSDIPFLGQILFQHDIVIYMSLAFGLLMIWVLGKTRIGLIIQVVGENPHAAHNIGIGVYKVRFLAILFGAALAGLGGVYAATVLTPIWADGLIAGRGWIAIALVVFSTWKPQRLLIGSYLFGAALLGELALQATGINIPSQLMTSIPYILTIFVLAFVSRDLVRIRLNAPVTLGETY